MCIVASMNGDLSMSTMTFYARLVHNILSSFLDKMEKNKREFICRLCENLKVSYSFGYQHLLITT